MDFSRILNKPFFIRNIPWTTAGAQYTFLPGARINVPKDLYTNSLARIPFDSSVFFRAKITMLLQVSGTPMHQGMLVASAHPSGRFADDAPSQTVLNMGAIMTAPHVFLSANEASSVALEVPFYVQGQLNKTDVADNTVSPYFFLTNYAEVDMYVLNPLVVAGTASTSVNVSVHAMFSDVEFYVPHTDVIFPLFAAEASVVDGLSAAATKSIDTVFKAGKILTGDILDVFRRGVKSWTGLHNPNLPSITNKAMVVYRQTNNVDNEVRYEKMDPFVDFDRITRDYIFDTDRDEMSLRYILQKPQYLGNFRVQTSDTAGTLLWARPMTPCQQAIPTTYFNSLSQTVETSSFSNQLQLIHTLSKYWRGSLKIHIQAVMTNFQFAKITLARDYSFVKREFIDAPEFTSVQNLMTDTYEFSAGGQVQTAELPYCSPLNQLICSQDQYTNACQHGMYYIYLTQPMVVNGTVPTSINFNVYVSAGDDIDFYGYATTPLRIQNFGSTVAPPTFSAESAVVYDTSDQQELLIHEEQGNSNQHNSMEMRPLVSVRDLVRRPIRVFSSRLRPSDVDLFKKTIVFDVATLLGVRGGSPNAPASETCPTTHLLQKLFYGYNGGGRFKFVIQGANASTVWYVPPDYMVDSLTDPYTYGTVPMNDIFPNTTNQVREQVGQMYELLKFNDALQLDTRFSSQTICQEKPNYFIPGSTLTSYQAGSGDHYVNMATHINEIEVPNFTQYRFVGDVTKLRTPASAMLQNTCTSNMGHLILAVEKPVQFDINLEMSIQIDIFACVDDTARMGYQVDCPIVQFPATVDTFAVPTKYWKFAQFQPGGVALPGIPYGMDPRVAGVINYART